MKIYDERESPLPSDITETIELGERPEISVFLPVFNEEPNLRPLQSKLNEALKKLGRSAEIVYVDDGSTDDSLKILREIAEADPRVRVVALRRNYGQTAAMAAGMVITIGGVAFATAFARDRLWGLLERSEGPRHRFGLALEIGSAALVLFLGVVTLLRSMRV